MKLSLESIINDAAAWQAKGVALPKFDIAAMRKRTAETPQWVHFGAGNIFRGFIAALQQKLLNQGLADRGIIAADTFDYEIISRKLRKELSPGEKAKILTIIQNLAAGNHRVPGLTGPQLLHGFAVGGPHDGVGGIGFGLLLKQVDDLLHGLLVATHLIGDFHLAVGNGHNGAQTHHFAHKGGSRADASQYR